MAGDITRQRNFQTEPLSYLFQFVVYEMCAASVLCATVRAVLLNNGQQIQTLPGIVFVYDFLHGFLPFDEQLLAGFLAAVAQYAALQVFLLQESHVDKRHPSGIE